MRSVLRTTVMLMAFLACVGTTRVFAQEVLDADVPFKFVASGKTYEPGKYELRVSDGLADVEILGPSKSSGVISVMTRLSPARGANDSRLVFDKIGETYHLSEMWLPSQDGFLLWATKEKHTHHEVKLNKRGQAK